MIFERERMTENKTQKLFGTDGIRGRANQFPMNVETVLALGRAAGKVLRRHSGKHRVVIGKDTRLSCYMFENALISGLCSMGIDTLMVGPLPTPGVAFITRAYRADAGIVISASHNAYFDNGIKFFSSEGFKLSDSIESDMENLVAMNNFSDALPLDEEIGKNRKVIDADGRYIEFVKATFPRKLSLKGMKIVLDCAHGAGYRVAPLIFKELDADLFVYCNQPNGRNINLDCGSLHPEIVQKAVVNCQADIGIALDGDADRVVLVDENGQIVDGDTMLAISAYDMKKKGLLQNDTVVGTVMSNLGFIKSMENIGVRVLQSKVGDRYVIQEMLSQGANLGGEQSGHLIFLDHNTTGDGLVSALQVLRIMIETGSKLSDLATIFKRYPQALVNVRVSKKPPMDSMLFLKEMILKVEKNLGSEGRVLVRYSGTEDICRVMVEGERYKMVKEFANSIALAVKQEIGV